MNAVRTLTAGLTATAAVTGMLAATPLIGRPRLRTPEILGALSVGHGDRAVQVGYALHTVTGTALAFGYRGVWRATGVSPTVVNGTAFGAVHGVIAAVLVAATKGRVPMALRDGLPDRAESVFGHACYGAVLALLLQPSSTTKE